MAIALDEARNQQFEQFVRVMQQQRIRGNPLIQNIELARRDVTSYLTQLSHTLENLNRLQIQADALDTHDAEFERQMHREWGTLHRLAGVEDIRVDPDEGTIVLTTPVLDTQLLRDGTVRRLGKFELRFGRSNIPLITRLEWGDGLDEEPDDRQYTIPHPHANTHNEPCLGNIYEDVVRYMADNHLVAAADAMLTFVKHINEDDSWGHRVYSWPLAPGSAQPEPGFRPYTETPHMRGEHETCDPYECEESGDYQCSEGNHLGWHMEMGSDLNCNGCVEYMHNLGQHEYCTDDSCYMSAHNNGDHEQCIEMWNATCYYVRHFYMRSHSYCEAAPASFQCWRRRHLVDDHSLCIEGHNIQFAVAAGCAAADDELREALGLDADVDLADRRYTPRLTDDYVPRMRVRRR